MDIEVKRTSGGYDQSINSGFFKCFSTGNGKHIFLSVTMTSKL